MHDFVHPPYPQCRVDAREDPDALLEARKFEALNPKIVDPNIGPKIVGFPYHQDPNKVTPNP